MWVSGYPLSKFDPETRKFTHFNEVPSSYDVKIGQNGDPWFTSPQNNKIGKVDSETMKATQWTLHTDKSFPRRLEAGPDGMIWIGEFSGGKIARFAPMTQTFKQYPLPGPYPIPKSPCGNSSEIRKGECGMSQTRITKLGIST